MKKLSFILLAFVGLNTFAQRQLILVNRSNLAESISMNCITDKCEYINTKLNVSGIVINEKELWSGHVTNEANKDLSRRDKQRMQEQGLTDYRPYAISESVEMGKGYLLPLTFIADTLLLPWGLIGKYEGTESISTPELKKSKRTAKKLESMIESEFDHTSKIKKLSKKRFNRIKSFLNL